MVEARLQKHHSCTNFELRNQVERCSRVNKGKGRPGQSLSATRYKLPHLDLVALLSGMGLLKKSTTGIIHSVYLIRYQLHEKAICVNYHQTQIIQTGISAFGSWVSRFSDQFVSKFSEYRALGISGLRNIELF